MSLPESQQKPAFGVFLPQRGETPEVPPPAEAVAQAGPSARELLRRKSTGRTADQLFRYLVLACALSIIAIVIFIVSELVKQSKLSIDKFGFSFFTGHDWDPVSGIFGAVPFIYGTLVSSAIALVIAVPLGVGVAVFMTNMCPRPLRGLVSYLVELLAAIPSVIYGLWGIFVLAPFLRKTVDPFLANYFGWTGLFSGPQYGIGMLAAGVILSIMIVPFISSVTREVMLAVPSAQREAVMALGATRWETIRIGVLRNARAGVFGGIILALGRALGETMAVTMLIGNRPEVAKSLFAPGYTMASVIANEFSEATDDLYLSALVEVGLALFIVTVIVNIIAQLMIWTITRGHKAGAHA
jgi:phosphate transport system permease protein